MIKAELRTKMMAEYGFTFTGKNRSKKEKVAEYVFDRFWDGKISYPQMTREQVEKNIRYGSGLGIIGWWLLKYFISELLDFLEKKYNE